MITHAERESNLEKEALPKLLKLEYGNQIRSQVAGLKAEFPNNFF